MGWYMVQSGLEDRFHGDSDIPRVSQYRLAAHLSLAFILYTLLLWSALDHLLPARRLTEAASASARRFRWLTHTCKGMIFLTAFSGKKLGKRVFLYYAYILFISIVSRLVITGTNKLR
jgi:cytochrome c oxidase assembly protein subunit 15